MGKTSLYCLLFSYPVLFTDSKLLLQPFGFTAKCLEFFFLVVHVNSITGEVVVVLIRARAVRGC